MERWLIARSDDLTIVGADGNKPYLRRYWVLKSKLLSIYVHKIFEGDPADVHHDHPWPNVTIVLREAYLEELLRSDGSIVRRWLREGDIVVRKPKTAHIIRGAAGSSPALTLFIAGPRIRVWGFRCPRGWVPWYLMVDSTSKGRLAHTCEDLGADQ